MTSNKAISSLYTHTHTQTAQMYLTILQCYDSDFPSSFQDGMLQCHLCEAVYDYSQDRQMNITHKVCLLNAEYNNTHAHTHLYKQSIPEAPAVC